MMMMTMILAKTYDDDDDDPCKKWRVMVDTNKNELTAMYSKAVAMQCNRACHHIC